MIGIKCKDNMYTISKPKWFYYGIRNHSEYNYKHDMNNVKKSYRELMANSYNNINWSNYNLSTKGPFFSIILRKMSFTCKNFMHEDMGSFSWNAEDMVVAEYPDNYEIYEWKY